MTHDETDLHETGTALTAPASPRGRTAARIAPAASFLSQLIAEHQHLAPQRARRRAPPAVAVGAYDAGAHIADRRLPAGYRKSLTA